MLLIDADEQGSAMDFTRQRQQRMKDGPGYTAIQTREADVAVQVRQMAPKYGDIIIDVGGRDTASQRAALAVAETLLIPFSPTSVDLWTADTVVALLKDAQPFNPGIRAYAVLNKAFSRGSDNIEAAAILREYPEHWSLCRRSDRQPQSLQQRFRRRVRRHRVSAEGPQGHRRDHASLPASF